MMTIVVAVIGIAFLACWAVSMWRDYRRDRWLYERMQECERRVRLIEKLTLESHNGS